VFVRAQYGDHGVYLEGGLTTASKEVLQALHSSITKELLSGVQDFGALVPCIKLIGQKLRDHCWSLIRLILLEGRILLYSQSQSLASQSCWALASLLPGTITSGLGYDSPSIAVPLFRWKKYGLPLQIFNHYNHSILVPNLPISQCDSIFNHYNGYLVATSNQMIGSLPHAQPDVIFNLDTGILTRTPMPSSLTSSLTEKQKLQQRRLNVVFDSSGGKGSYFFQQLLFSIDDYYPQLKKKYQISLKANQSNNLISKWSFQLTNQSSSTTTPSDEPTDVPSIITPSSNHKNPTIPQNHHSEENDYENDSDDDCIGVSSSSSWEGSEGWVHAEIQRFFEEVLEAGDQAIENEMIEEEKLKKQYLATTTTTSSTTSGGLSSFWGGSSSGGGGGWARKVEEAALNVANRADALALERGWDGSGMASKLLKQKSSVGSSFEAIVSPLVGPDFLIEWIQTNNYKIWKKQIVLKIEQKMLKEQQKNLLLTKTPNDSNDLKVILKHEESSQINDSGSNGNSGDGNEGNASSGGGGFLMNILDKVSTTSNLLTNGTIESLKLENDSNSKLPTSGYGSFVYPTGDRYLGEWLNGQRHGQGVCVYVVSGDKHDGEWVQDAPHGHGTFTTGSGDFIYDGEWSVGRRTGRGHAVWHGRRESYTGDFEDGEFHGTGVHCGCNGDVFNGEFVKGRRNGVGTVLRNSQDTTTHDKEGLRKFSKSNQLEFDSSENKAFTSPSQMVWSSKGVILSNRNDVLVSSGSSGSSGDEMKLTSVNQLPWVKYSGEWCDGIREGIGTCNYQNGMVYTGSWRFDKPFGEGEFKTTTTSESEQSDEQSEGADYYLFNGEWQHGLKHGEGKEEMNIVTYSDPVKRMKYSREGRWERDSPIAGEWCLVWRSVSTSTSSSSSSSTTSSTSTSMTSTSMTSLMTSSNRFDMDEVWYGEGDRSYVGYACEKGLPEGVGTMKYKQTGAVYSGEWLNGRRHGQGVCVYADGSYHKGEWSNDAPVNRSLMFEEISLGDEDWKAPTTTAAWPLGDDSLRKNTLLTNSNHPQDDLSDNENQTEFNSQISSMNQNHLNNTRRRSFSGSKSMPLTSLTPSSTSSNHLFEFVENGQYRLVRSDGLFELLGKWNNLQKHIDNDIVDSVTTSERNDQSSPFPYVDDLYNGSLIEHVLLPRSKSTNNASSSTQLYQVSEEIVDELASSSSSSSSILSNNTNDDVLHSRKEGRGNGGVTGVGRAVDALAGLVYQGDWCKGFPHGQGLLIKTCPAGRISAVLSTITSNQEISSASLSSLSSYDTSSPSIEWFYKGEFSMGKFSGVGTFERKSKEHSQQNDSHLSTSSTTETLTSTSESSTSSVVMAALAATSSSLSSKVNKDHEHDVVTSLIPKDDPQSVPWAQHIHMMIPNHDNVDNHNLNEKNENEINSSLNNKTTNKEVWSLLWYDYMRISSDSSDWIKYSGEFKNGEICGTGTAVYKDGSEYSGSWKSLSDRSISSSNHGNNNNNIDISQSSDDNKMNHLKQNDLNGGPCCELSSLLMKELSSLPDGQGIWKNHQNTCSFQGEWSCGLPHGMGEFIFSYSCFINNNNENIENSDFKRNNNFHIISRKEEREGKWKKGIPSNGDWKICFYDSNSSSNSHLNNEVLVKTHNGQYVGNMIEGRPDGIGVCKYSTGSLYSGSWKEGRRHGQGSCVWSNGDAEFTGEWEDDGIAQETIGQLRLPGGEIRQFNGMVDRKDV